MAEAFLPRWFRSTPFRPRALRRAVALAAVLAASGCARGAPEVTRSVTADDQGRTVVTYRICEQRVPVLGEAVCRTETAVQNYCYRSIARIDCYRQAQPGRTLVVTAD